MTLRRVTNPGEPKRTTDGVVVAFGLVMVHERQTTTTLGIEISFYAAVPSRPPSSAPSVLTVLFFSPALHRRPGCLFALLDSHLPGPDMIRARGTKMQIRRGVIFPSGYFFIERAGRVSGRVTERGREG